MPQNRRPVIDGNHIQPIPGDRLRPPEKPPQERTDYDGLIDYHNGYTPRQRIQLHRPVAQGVEGEEKVEKIQNVGGHV